MDLTELLVTLERVDMPVWPRILVSSSAKLGGLHRVIRAAMGWSCRRVRSLPRMMRKAFTTGRPARRLEPPAAI